MNPPSSQSSPSAGAQRALYLIDDDITLTDDQRAAIIDRETGAGELAAASRELIALLDARWRSGISLGEISEERRRAMDERDRREAALRAVLKRYEGPTPAAPDLSDSGPYATGDDKQTAKELGVTVAALRADRAAEDRAAPVSDSREVAALREAAAVLEGVTLLPNGKTYKRAHSALAMVREVLGEQ